MFTPFVVFRPKVVQVQTWLPMTLYVVNPVPGVPAFTHELKLNTRLAGSIPSPLSASFLFTALALEWTIVSLKLPPAAGTNLTNIVFAVVNAEAGIKIVLLKGPATSSEIEKLAVAVLSVTGPNRLFAV